MIFNDNSDFSILLVSNFILVLITAEIAGWGVLVALKDI